MGDRLKRALLEKWQEHLEETVDRSMFSAIYLRSSKSQLILQDIGAPWSCGVQLWGVISSTILRAGEWHPSCQDCGSLTQGKSQIDRPTGIRVNVEDTAMALSSCSCANAVPGWPPATPVTGECDTQDGLKPLLLHPWERCSNAQLRGQLQAHCNSR